MRTVIYKTTSGAKPAIAKEGRTKIHLLMIEATGVTVARVDKSEGRYITELEMPMKKALRGFKRAGKNLGMTKGAKAFIDTVGA